MTNRKAVASDAGLSERWPCCFFMIATSPLMFGKRRISNNWAGERDASPEAQQSHHGLRTAIATNSTTWKKPDNVAPLPRQTRN